jgi:hypothetical protein
VSVGVSAGVSATNSPDIALIIVPEGSEQPTIEHLSPTQAVGLAVELARIAGDTMAFIELVGNV